MVQDPRLPARMALLEEASRRQPSAVIYHSLARLRLDCGDGVGAARACWRAAELGGAGVWVDSVIIASDTGFHPPETQVRRARMLMEHGFITPVVISLLARASVALRDEATVRSLMDYPRFHRCEPQADASRLPLRKIADIFLASPAWYGEPADRAIRHASRYDAIAATSEIPEVAALAALLRKAAEGYIAQSRDDIRDWHPFTASIPPEFTIEAWGVISGRTGYHKSHIHPRAWATGVLYIIVPGAAEDPENRIGWLRVGPPDDLKTAVAGGWEERWIKPAPGLMTMMPGYFTHETLPMERDEERVCVAFDIVPRQVGATTGLSQFR